MKSIYHEKVPNICSDFFFHYLMQHSTLLRKELCIYLSHDYQISSTTVEYNDTYASLKGGRKYIMDIVIKDDKGRYYNFEMQNGYISENDMKRFQIYAMRLVDRQMKDKTEVKNVHKVRQLVIYTGLPIKNFKHCFHKINLYDKKYQVLLEKGLLTMNFIQLQKMEEEVMEVMNRGLQEVMMLFKDNEKIDVVTPVGKEVVELYRQFVQSEDYIPYLQAERDRWVINYRIDEAKEAGLSEGKLLSLEKLIEQKYHVKDLDWLSDCTDEQLDKIVSIIFNDLTYGELKEEVMK